MNTALALLAIVISGATPLSLPGNFDPAVNMTKHVTETGVYHESRSAAGLAAQLVANGTPEDLALAEKVLEATLACQELRPEKSRYGNFFWMREDDEVRDTNAVEFVFSSLIPMMLHHRDRLSPEMRDRVLASIRLGLDDIRRMDVSLSYTNMAVYDIANTCLGGELLQDASIAQRGYQKLRDWEAFTCANGTAFEFNSPTYIGITVGRFDDLIDMVKDDDTRIRAKALIARLGLSVALRIHRGTGYWAGPHSRAYQPTVEGRDGPHIEGLRRWGAHGTVPAWVASVPDVASLPMQVVETASRARGIDLTTYHSSSFAMGLATRGNLAFGRQSNRFIVHYTRPDQKRPGVVYARYLLNDKWLGDWYHTTDRTSSRNLLDEGRFYGVQSGPRAIGVYTAGSVRECTSAKCVLIWTRRKAVDEIWAGNRRIETLPAQVEPGEVVVVGSGGAFVAVRPLTLTDFGDGAPIRLVERGGDLVLEMYNYLGPERELRFAKGHNQCGFYAEAAERSQYPDGRTFGQAVSSGRLTDRVKDSRRRPWTIEYARDGEKLGLEVELQGWRLKRRWNTEGTLDWPMLESSVARQNASGRVVVGDAVLKSGPHPAWLYADPSNKTWVAGYHGPSAPLKLTVPGGEVRIESMGTGTVEWKDGVVRVEAVGLQGVPEVTGGTLE